MSPELAAAQKLWRSHPKGTAKSLLGRILRIFFRRGWTYLGDRLQPVLDHPERRTRVDEEGLMKSAPFAACGSGKIVKIVVSIPRTYLLGNCSSFISSDTVVNAVVKRKRASHAPIPLLTPEIPRKSVTRD